MPDYSRPGLPPRPYGSHPPTSRPILMGQTPPAPLLSEGVAITCGGPSFRTGWIQVSVEVDGYELPPMPWGRIEIAVLPGSHTFRVFRRVEGRILSFTELVEQVRPGQLLELLYTFYANDLNQWDSTRPGGREAMLIAVDNDGKGALTAVLLIFGFIAVVFALMVGAALLLRLA